MGKKNFRLNIDIVLRFLRYICYPGCYVIHFHFFFFLIYYNCPIRNQLYASNILFADQAVSDLCSISNRV